MVTPTWVRHPPGGTRMVHVNSTAVGGGVAELLQGLVPAQAAAGVPVGWAVIGGTDRFYAVTKYLHHLLHDRADPKVIATPGFLAPYRSVLASQADWLAGQVTTGDVVVLHDPQTLGMAGRIAETGASVVWHCHIGTRKQGAAGPAAAWRAFAADLAALDAAVAAVPEFIPSVPAGHRHVAAPAIDPDAAKNRPLSASEIIRLLTDCGLTGRCDTGPYAVTIAERPLPDDARVVAQLSRWDPLKDMPGVLRTVPELPPDTHLVLAGTDPAEIPDDPEGAAVLDEVRTMYDGLATADRRRVHLVLTPARATERGALIVNAIQRRADVVVQKSLEEGFGLAVTEAMYKRRAVVASDVGGLREQITHGRTGLLVDPVGHTAAAYAIRALLDNPAYRRRLGERAAAQVRARYTMPRLAADYRRFASLTPATERAMG